MLQIPFLRRSGLLVWPRWAWHEEGVAKIRPLMLPGLFGVSVNQINLLLDTVIANFMVPGTISWLYYADRLLEFPLGIFGVALSTVLLPTLARQHAVTASRSFSVESPDMNRPPSGSLRQTPSSFSSRMGAPSYRSSTVARGGRGPEGRNLANLVNGLSKMAGRAEGLNMAPDLNRIAGALGPDV